MLFVCHSKDATSLSKKQEQMISLRHLDHFYVWWDDQGASLSVTWCFHVFSFYTFVYSFSKWLQIYLQPLLYSHPLFSICMFLFSCWCVCMCVFLHSPALGYLEGSVLQSVRGLALVQPSVGGGGTETLLDAKWTGNFSSLDAAPENSSFLFLTRIFPLMMCGQPANLSKNKSEWFIQLHHSFYFTSFFKHLF